MTNKQRRILEDAEISSELMHEVDHYLKDVAAVLVVAIIGIVYACALIENHKDANGRTADTIEYYENIEEIG